MGEFPELEKHIVPRVDFSRQQLLEPPLRPAESVAMRDLKIPGPENFLEVGIVFDVQRKACDLSGVLEHDAVFDVDDVLCSLVADGEHSLENEVAGLREVSPLGLLCATFVNHVDDPVEFLRPPFEVGEHGFEVHELGAVVQEGEGPHDFVVLMVPDVLVHEHRARVAQNYHRSEYFVLLACPFAQDSLR